MKRAIIIGASSGIGREVSKLLLADGWHIGIAARREKLLQEIKSICAERVETMQIDVTSGDAPQRLLTLIKKIGGIDLLFYASGIGKQNTQLDTQTEKDTAEVNVMGFTQIIGTAFNYMAEHDIDGHIAVISSIAGTKGLGVAPSYSASKAYQSAYIQALEQLASIRHLHISFTDIRPGFVATDLLSNGHYPMLMDKTVVARNIVKAVYAHRHVFITDWRYHFLVLLWCMIPRWLWRRLRITTR